MEEFKIFKKGENEEGLKKLAEDTFNGKSGGYDDANIRKIESLTKNPSDRKDILKLDNLEKIIKELWSKIKILKGIKDLEAEKRILNNQNFELHNNEFSSYDVPKNDIEIELDKIDAKIFFLTQRAKEENITIEQLNDLQNKFNILNSEYEDLRDASNPSLN